MTTEKKLLAVLQSVPGSDTAATIERPSAAAPNSEEANRAKRFAQLNKLVAEAGGERYRGYQFSHWQATSSKQSAVKAVVEEWASTFPERQRRNESLILMGPVGTGKDHLMFAAVANSLLRYGVSVTWRNGRELMGEVRDRIGEEKSEASFIGSLKAPQLLVISDPLPILGPLTPHQADVLYRIVDARYGAGRPTCLTINVSTDNEADNRLGAATWDRVCEGAWKIICNWPSHRKPARVVSPK